MENFIFCAVYAQGSECTFGAEYSGVLNTPRF